VAGLPQLTNLALPLSLSPLILCAGMVDTPYLRFDLDLRLGLVLVILIVIVVLRLAFARSFSV